MTDMTPERKLATMAAEYFDCAIDQEFIDNFTLDILAQFRKIENVAYEKVEDMVQKYMRRPNASGAQLILDIRALKHEERS